jgi:hypothetical protein
MLGREIIYLAKGFGLLVTHKQDSLLMELFLLYVQLIKAER